MSTESSLRQVTPALQDILSQLSDAAAVLSVAQRSLERQEIASDEVLLLRQSIAALLDAHNRLDEIIR